jgi:hypothetical protein
MGHFDDVANNDDPDDNDDNGVDGCDSDADRRFD